MKGNKIYILVYVSYDWYRFQENILVSDSLKELYISPKGALDYYHYENRDTDLCRDLDELQQNHYWIQTLTIQ